MFLLMDYQSFHYVFFKCTQNSPEYLLQNMIHLVIQIYHSMVELILQICCYYMSVLYFFMCNIYQGLIKQLFFTSSLIYFISKLKY